MIGALAGLYEDQLLAGRRRMEIKAIDIESELRNWAAFVHWGDDGSPDEGYASIERQYADHPSRFQYESRIRKAEPRIQDGYLLERLISHPDFPVVWKRVLRVQYLDWPDAPGVWTAEETYEDKLRKRARCAGVSERSYPDYLDGAKRELERLVLGGMTPTVKVDESTGRMIFLRRVQGA